MSFRQFGGLNYAPKHNIVASNYNTSNNLLVTQNVGQPNSYINFLSDISGNIRVYGDFDLSGNLNVSGDIDCSGNITAQYMFLSSYPPNINQSENSVVPKGYVDSIASGIKPLGASITVSFSPITLSGTGQTVSGVNLSSYVGSYILVNGQSFSTPDITNGVYIISAGIWSRSTYLEPGGTYTEANGTLTTILQGDYQNHRYICVSNPSTVDQDPLLWSEFDIPYAIGQGLETIFVNNETILQVDPSLNFLTLVDASSSNPTLDIGTENALTITMGKLNGSTTTNINGNTSITGTLTVTGNTSLSTLTTSGLATLNSTSITNNSTVGGTLTVTGNTSLSTLTTSGLATLNSTSITNNASIGGTLTVTGLASFNTVCPQSSVTPINNNDLCNKSYVDTKTTLPAVQSNNNIWTGTNAFNTSLPTSTLIPSSSNQLTNKSYVDQFINQTVPVGSIIMYGGFSLPANYLWCNGTAYPTSGTYAALYAVIGNLYGSSSGNFKVPNLQTSFPIGAKTMGSSSNPLTVSYQGSNVNIGGNDIMSEGQLASHTHSPPDYTGSGQPAIGYMAYVNSDSGDNVQTGGNGLNVNFSQQNKPTGEIARLETTPLQYLPPFTVVNFIIKYL